MSAAKIFEATAVRWTQNEKGEDVYTPDPDVLINPKNFVLQPDSRQLVRVGFSQPVGAMNLKEEGAWRVLFNEIPPVEQENSVSFLFTISLPLFTGGSNLAQLRYAEAEKKGLIATYEKSIQSAFKDVADALARRETLSEELDAQRQYVAAEQTSLDIAMKSYQAGVGDYLSVLTAQRTLWSAKTTLLSLQQTDLNNRITLWQSLGGGAS